MDKFNISFTQNNDNINNIFNKQNGKTSNQLLNDPITDNFEKNNNENSKIMDLASKLYFVNPDYYNSFVKELTHGLCVWADTFNCVNPIIKDDKIEKVQIGMLNTVTGDTDFTFISADEFKDLITTMTAMSISIDPENEQKYGKLYLKMLSFINKHSENE